MITVGFLASGFIGRGASGTAQTSRKLVVDLLRYHSDSIRVVLFCKTQEEKQLATNEVELSGADIEVFPPVWGSLFKSSRQFYKYCFKSKNRKVDILHFSVPRVYPFYWKFPARHFVCTFHAAGDITVKQEKIVISKNIYNLIMKLSWKRLEGIYSDSDFAQKEIAKAYKMPISIIKKIYLGADELMSHDLQPMKLPKEKVIVVVGRWQQYKNLHTVLDAIRVHDYKLGHPFHVFLIGKSQQMGFNLVQHAVALFDANRITVIDYLDYGQLRFLYQNASVVVHPSINEGFGLPAFEAFFEGSPLLVHLGTPASDELGAETGVWSANMLDIDEIFHCLREILDTELLIDLQARRSLMRDRQMTWQDMAKLYVQEYHAIVSSD